MDYFASCMFNVAACASDSIDSICEIKFEMSLKSLRALLCT